MDESAGVLSEIPLAVREALAAAWRVRRDHWPSIIAASYPTDTLPISVTGHACALDCAHCGGHYLLGMKPLAELERVEKPSVLVSGGSDRRGKVPVLAHLDALVSLTAGKKRNWHLGLVSEEEATALAAYLDVVSFDFVGDEETLRRVYGLETSVADYEASLETLCRHARMVVPHVTIGLDGGNVGHERKAFEILSRYSFNQLVLLVFIPTPGTRFATAAPPALEKVAQLLAEARMRFPALSLQLGCMRPGGAYRQRLDVLAVAAGLNVIVNPTRSAKDYAARRGLAWREMYECCVFVRYK